MKKKLLFILFSFLSFVIIAQTPNSFSYQTVIRNNNNELVANTTVGVRISILSGEAADKLWYQEEHNIRTNMNGLAYITIGRGKIISGTTTSIDWSNGVFFIKSEVDPNGGKNYSLVVISQILSVPFAIHAKTAEKVSTPIIESDPLFNSSVAKGITHLDTANWNRKSIFLDTNNLTFDFLRNKDTASLSTRIDNKLNITDTVVMLSPYLKKSEALDNALALDSIFNMSVAKGITSVDTSLWNNKISPADTINMLRPYLLKNDTLILSNRINLKSDLSAVIDSLVIRDKLIGTKLNIFDTSSMLLPYLRKLDTTSLSDRIDAKANLVVINNSLSSLAANTTSGLDSKVNLSDTAVMLNPYLLKSDTTSLSDRINKKADLSSMNLIFQDMDTRNLESFLTKLNVSDTFNMLNPYLRKIDTTSLSERIDRKADSSEFISIISTLSTRTSDDINTKLNVVDTSVMLLPYLLKADTLSLSNRIENKADFSEMTNLISTLFSGNSTVINTKIGSSDTATMLLPYLRKADTLSLSERINQKATASELSSLEDNIAMKLNKADTLSLSERINQKANASELTSLENNIAMKLNKADTLSLSERINQKANASELSSLEDNIAMKLNKADTLSLSERINNKIGLPTTGNATGSMLIWNGSNWINLSPGQNGQILKIINGMPTWSGVELPDPPTNINATAGNSSASVSFTPPLNNGGSPILNYIVTSNPENISSSGSNSPISVSGLTNGQSYTFTLVAVNSIGASVVSSVSNSIIPISSTPTVLPPTAPLNVEGISGTNLITLTWTAPTTDGGSPVTGYKIVYGQSSSVNRDTITVGNVLSYEINGLTGGMEYSIRLAAVNSAGIGAYSGEILRTPSSSTPTVTVPDPPINFEAIGGPNKVTLTWNSPLSNGGSNITGYFIVYGFTNNLDRDTLAVGNVLNYEINNLQIGVSYTFKIAASNNIGMGEFSISSLAVPICPTTLSFVCPTEVNDIDGNTYDIVTIGNQCWFKGNLKVTKYRDSTDIPEVTDNSTWAGLSTGARSSYNNDGSNLATYGYLYNWFAISSKPICPTGWHVPTDAEWTCLETYLVSNLGSSAGVGSALKKNTGPEWQSFNASDNSSGFTALPSGWRDNDGIFRDLTSFSLFWTATEGNSNTAWSRDLVFFINDVNRTNGYLKSNGAAIRCVRD